MTDTLLAHVVSKFSARQWENIATEALRFLLEGAAREAPARVVSRFLDLPAALSWRAQVADEGTGIPDLVGEDNEGRPVAMIEGKFWVQLTRHQPSSYLQRQAQHFPAEASKEAAGRALSGARRSHVLMFLVPTQRQALVAGELAQRMGCASHHDPDTGLDVVDNGQLVLVLCWARMLEEVRNCLIEAGDLAGLNNLEQLVGLCDRADREAMLPFTDEDLDTATARRLLDFYDLVDLVTDELVRRRITSTTGLKATSTRAHYGRYQQHAATGVVVQVNFSTWWWAHEYHSPLWLRLWKPDPLVTQAWRELAATKRLAHVAGSEKDGFARAALSIPLGVESHVAVTALADQVEVALAAIPTSAVHPAEPEPVEEPASPA
jgi:hypothetical protein